MTEYGWYYQENFLKKNLELNEENYWIWKILEKIICIYKYLIFLYLLIKWIENVDTYIPNNNKETLIIK